METAAALLARGMADNPNHVHAFGADEAPRRAALEGMFRMILAHQADEGRVLGAFHGRRLAGVCGMMPPGRCPSTLGSRFAALSALFMGSGLRHSRSVLDWLEDWTATDPDVEHWHLGPAAVEPTLRRRGIGDALLRACCEMLDAEGVAGYLENDRRENLAWLRRHGFEIIDEHQVLGAPNWFMLRTPPDAAAQPAEG
ncbi:GNAT family N-acetyltransferase [Thioalkalivibrio sp. XN279]|uniref:GNAT family N-acetyltransferase n=1 Tax=Thioalkalivibrio sp. XN279 TaxID=2714953 RepID=UPI001407CE48|nr:GNAT family N-acetyltransferase [Thioalkalivibrio sp. XN279]NHA15093.1 GNAT family N-acetyltransferase [Thioalkalivibrio sp. XN279]